eukprot:1160381-Pelagomonas_calceolata.AAC.2
MHTNTELRVQAVVQILMVTGKDMHGCEVNFKDVTLTPSVSGMQLPPLFRSPQALHFAYLFLGQAFRKEDLAGSAELKGQLARYHPASQAGRAKEQARYHNGGAARSRQDLPLQQAEKVRVKHAQMGAIW